MGWMPDIPASGDGRGQAADGQDPAPGGQFGEERIAGGDLDPGRPPVRALRPRMRGDDVPAEGVQIESGERPLDDLRARLGRPLARELPLRGERDAGDSGAAVAGRLADKDQRRARVRFEVLAKAAPAQFRAVTRAVEIERRADL